MIGLMRNGMQGFSVWQKGNRLANQVEMSDGDDDGDWREIHRTLSEEEVRSCSELADLFGAVPDSKWNLMRKILRELGQEPGARAIVFTQWIPTLNYLSRMASQESGFRAFAISGEVNELVMNRTLKEFNEHEGFSVLFTTDLLSEGIDLQAANVIINYDFPYNPQRVEQRIGRIDRIGQQSSRIEIYNLWVKDSIDESIVDLLDKRLDLFREAIGDANSLFKIKLTATGKPQLLSYTGPSVRDVARLNASLLLPVESFLDSKIRSLRSEANVSLDRFAWLAIVRMIAIATGGRMRIVEETDANIRLGPISDSDIQVISEWLGIDLSGPTIQELLAFRDSESTLLLAKKFGVKGLYLPITHPLTTMSLLVARNSYGKAGGEDTVACLESRVNSEGIERMLVCKYTFRASDSRFSKVQLWVKKGMRYTPIAERDDPGYQAFLINATPRINTEPTPVELDRSLLQQIARHAVDWSTSVNRPEGYDTKRSENLIEFDFAINNRNALKFEISLAPMGKLTIQALAAIDHIP
jgi:hypothetical protein